MSITNLELIEGQLRAAAKRHDNTIKIFYVARHEDGISIQRFPADATTTAKQVLEGILALGMTEAEPENKDLPTFYTNKNYEAA